MENRRFHVASKRLKKTAKVALLFSSFSYSVSRAYTVFPCRVLENGSCLKYWQVMKNMENSKVSCRFPNSALEDFSTFYPRRISNTLYNFGQALKVARHFCFPNLFETKCNRDMPICSQTCRWKAGRGEQSHSEFTTKSWDESS